MFSMFDELKMAMAILKQKMAILDRKKKDWTDSRSLIMKNPLKKRLYLAQTNVTCT